MSGIGAGFDSIFEYLFKSYMLFGDVAYLHMFQEAMSSLRRNLRSATPGVYLNVHMSTRQVYNYWVDSLQAYMPALLTLAGAVHEAVRMHALFEMIWRKYSAMPERFNIMTKSPDVGVYPLRPELAESTYYLYRSTRDPKYLLFGRKMVEDINQFMRTECGFATLHDVRTKTLEDRMESFFLSEVSSFSEAVGSIVLILAML